MRRRENLHRDFDRHTKSSHNDQNPAQSRQEKSGSPEQRHFKSIQASIPDSREDVRRDDWGPSALIYGSAVLQPRDVLTIEELNAFADEVAEFVEDSRFAAIEERLMLDMDRLDRADRQLASSLQMRANPASA